MALLDTDELEAILHTFPETNLERQLNLAREIRICCNKADKDLERIAELSLELADLTRSLHDWIRAGSRLPTEWAKAHGLTESESDNVQD